MAATGADGAAQDELAVIVIQALAALGPLKDLLDLLKKCGIPLDNLRVAFSPTAGNQLQEFTRHMRSISKSTRDWVLAALSKFYWGIIDPYEKGLSSVLADFARDNPESYKGVQFWFAKPEVAGHMTENMRALEKEGPGREYKQGEILGATMALPHGFKAMAAKEGKIIRYYAAVRLSTDLDANDAVADATFKQLQRALYDQDDQIPVTYTGMTRVHDLVDDIANAFPHWPITKSNEVSELTAALASFSLDKKVPKKAPFSSEAGPALSGGNSLFLSKVRAPLTIRMSRQERLDYLASYHIPEAQPQLTPAMERLLKNYNDGRARLPAAQARERRRMEEAERRRQEEEEQRERERRQRRVEEERRRGQRSLTKEERRERRSRHSSGSHYSNSTTFRSADGGARSSGGLPVGSSDKEGRGEVDRGKKRGRDDDMPSSYR